MNLRQQLDEMIAQWDGSDALERSQRREQLVSDLMTLLQKKGVSRRNGNHVNSVKHEPALVPKDRS